jgi:hypothetical protein
MAYTQRPSSAGRQFEVSVDRVAIREVLSRLANPELKNDWCIACGAGKSAAPLGDTRQLTDLTKEVMQGKSLPEFVDGLRDLGQRAWCIACGAGKDASPLDMIGDPAALSDEAIDYVAANLLSAIKVG